MIPKVQTGEVQVRASCGDLTEVSDAGRKRKRKPIKKELHRFGNYHHYYGYRLGKTLDEDPRLRFLEREWFEGKDCLDIGCNEGLVTISIAQKYNCRRILGVDIDGVLIDKANLNLTERISSSGVSDSGENVEKRSEEERLLETGAPAMKEWWKDTIAWRALHSKETLDSGSNHTISGTVLERPSATTESVDLMQRVTFRQENFIKNFPHGDYMKDGTFDTVLCLSMTKWVHLNWGDDGLVRLFAKIFRILRPGGTLILEPQPWKSYQRKAGVCEATRANYNSIQLRPLHFTEILLDKIGFRSYRQVSTAVPGSTAGFDRSLFLYFK
ncbi:hypothetical protein R1sor_003095 [Riccia sorocarpa]|uniref:RNA methyltransferase n=1 Tax=Riccia sorocarpa TaxID=122646 RepID=A0ABD3H1F4_9MARC